MDLDPIEVGRLAKLQKYPLEYLERRVESIDLKDDHHYSVTVTQQIIIPSHGEGKQEVSQALIPVGYYSKTFLPDLRVARENGSELPVANRADRALLTAIIVGSPWEHLVLDAVPAGEKDAAEGLWTVVQDYIGEIATEQPKQAQTLFDDLRELLNEWGASSKLTPHLRSAAAAVIATPEFWTAVEAMIDTRLIVATIRGTTGEPTVVTCTYTERFSYVKQGQMRWLVSLLQWLGWLAYGITRRAANMGRTRSLWVLQSLPPGVEPIRSYWEDQANEAADDVALIAESDRTVANRYDEPLAAGDRPPSLLLDAQMAPSASVGIAALLSALLVCITTYIYQAPQLFASTDAGATQTNFIALAGVFAAVPAGVGAALAYNGQTFARRLSRGPRLVLALLSIQAAVLAVLICLKQTTHAIEVASLVLSVYSLFAAGVFAFIVYGPRWRKNHRSRWKWLTQPATPAGCQQYQRRIATAYLVVMLFCVLVFARCQTVLRYSHFFTRHFPGNIWHAWWSWFGL
jgi:hypothetical protein